MAPMHASISDLTTYSRDASGDVPKPSIGSSATVVGDKVYLFGGKSNTTRKSYSNDIYSFDLQASVWEKVIPTSPDHHTPTARYFHSADYWNGYLVIFGGLGISSTPNGDAQSILSDVRFFSLAERRWLEPFPSPDHMESEKSASFVPRPRFAHLSTVASSKLFILGGQDMVNEWLDDIHVYDLGTKQWISHVPYPRNCGTYRSAVVAPELVVRDPAAEGVPTTRPPSYFADLQGSSNHGPTPDSSSVMAPHPLHANSDKLVHMPYSAEPSPHFPAHLYIYSNWNFVDVRRELETVDPTPLTPEIVNRSTAMTAHSSTQPPGLRFPTAHILGTHLIIGGTYLAQSYQSYSIWALDLQSMIWTRIDPGTALTSGSWSRGVLWGSKNRFVVFGNRKGNLVEDYNRRVVNWDHVAYVELESLGIYQPPRPRLEIASDGSLAKGRLMGLDALDAELFADFEVLCEDGRRIKCSRALLEERWPWFRTNRRKYVDAAQRIIAGQKIRSDLEIDIQQAYPPSLADIDLSHLPLNERPDPRLTPRLLRLSEPYPITKALLQYFYTYDLLTPLQHAPLVLSSLLLISSIYDIPHLGELVRHAMHRTLGPMTSVGVYDVTTLCDCQNLNIRALRIVMSSNKRSTGRQQRPGTGGSSTGGGGGGG
ncbi:galactose oxidase, partial [Clavulina sp. PMI_390]